MVLKGGSWDPPDALPTIIPELQNRSVISVVNGSDHFGALTSSGKLLTWGQCVRGNLGLGDPRELPVGSPGGFEEQFRSWNYTLSRVTVPTEVRFDHGLTTEGRVRRCCFAAAAGGLNTAALVVDFAEGEVPPESLE